MLCQYFITYFPISAWQKKIQIVEFFDKLENLTDRPHLVSFWFVGFKAGRCSFRDEIALKLASDMMEMGGL